MLVFEELLILLASGISVFFIGIPSYKLYRTFFPPKRDSLKEAQERFKQAQLDMKTAKLNEEAQHLYDQMYSETLESEELIDKESKKL